MKNIPRWMNYTTIKDVIQHPTAEAWVEIHEHPGNGKELCVAIDTSGCDKGIIAVGSYEDCCNAIGEQYGFDEFWVSK